MICSADAPMCMAGVFGGKNSGVTDSTTSVFLESAWFNPVSIRRTSLRHGLRTDAATRFEKGVDISNTVNVLKRAALLVKEVAGGEITGDLIDVYPPESREKRAADQIPVFKKVKRQKLSPGYGEKYIKKPGF